MKNSIKTGLVALVIAVSFSACDPAKKAPADTTAKIDSNAKVDSAVKVDSAAKPGAVIDSVKKDSVKK